MSGFFPLPVRRNTTIFVAGLLVTAAFPAAALAQTITVFEGTGAGTGFQQGTVAYSINDADSITGVVLDSGSVGHGFVRTANGKIAVFDANGAGTGIRQGTAGQDINASGEVTGYLIDANGTNHGFFRDASKKGKITVFDAKGAGTGNKQGTTGSAINDTGDITGSSIDLRVSAMASFAMGQRAKSWCSM